MCIRTRSISTKAQSARPVPDTGRNADPAEVAQKRGAPQLGDSGRVQVREHTGARGQRGDMVAVAEQPPALQIHDLGEHRAQL
ncbi:hypothetical protein ACH492_25730 [Streptomyces sp. NPDC019443]|uniref:hypothetical protein n=1 Tax=Streptomyces sp. NPDC019443 TaxID=3365061 RepID=UPI003793F4FF